MLIIKKIDELKDVLFNIKSNGKSVGFVPTMGALHEGHLSLVKRAKRENEVVVCSIFVNPTQFDNPSDLSHYPKTLEEDIALLESYADIVFAPEAKEVYPKPPNEIYYFGVIEDVMEGASRPNHFNGVAIIVQRLLSWIGPDKIYFGEKDYQQLVIIRKLVKDYFPDIQVIACPVVREKSGLAMSSRNRRLSQQEQTQAANIFRILHESQQINSPSVKQIKDFVVENVSLIPGLRLDYFEIADDIYLQPVHNMEEEKGIMGFIAVWLGEIRLIDNIRYK